MDHHVDSMHIDYPEAAKHFLQRHGMFKSGLPAINHKPGNDFLSDFYYPFPLYPDTRFVDPYEMDLEIKYPPDPPPPSDKDDGNPPYGDDFELPLYELEEMKSLKGPLVSYVSNNDRDGFIDGAAYPYTGLVLQAIEKKAFDITFIKPYYVRGVYKQKLIKRELVTGHLISIATYDGWKFHIYRGLIVDLVKTRPLVDPRHKLISRSVPFGNPIETIDLKKKDQKMLVEKNVKLILDVSKEFKGELVSIPLAQIIDAQNYNFIYDFTIYEGGLKVFFDDWLDSKDMERPETFFTYVPHDGLLPQSLYHDVIEHQKPSKIDCFTIDDYHEAIRFNFITLSYLLRKFKQNDAKATYKDKKLLLYNDNQKEWQTIPVGFWIIFDSVRREVTGVMTDKEFKKKYKTYKWE